MTSPFPALIGRYRSQGVLVDTNLLLVWLVGRAGPEHLKDFKRTSLYSIGDFQLIDTFLGQFEHHWTTPHILTEITNLAKNLSERRRAAFYRQFDLMVRSQREETLPAAQISPCWQLLQFGLADEVTLHLEPGQFLLVTDDLPLFAEACKRGIDTVNFNHLRDWKHFREPHR